MRLTADGGIESILRFVYRGGEHLGTEELVEVEVVLEAGDELATDRRRSEAPSSPVHASSNRCHNGREGECRPWRWQD